MNSEMQRLGMSVEEAGKALGLGRNSAYDAAQRGDIPTIKFGRRLIVPIAAFHEMLRSGVRKSPPTDATDPG